MTIQTRDRDAFAYCLEQVRREDRDRYLTLLFAPREHRPLLAALYAFNIECARAVTAGGEQAVLGQMRLQWWRDELAKGSEGGGAGAEQPALSILRSRPEIGLALQGLLSARERDLVESQFATLADVVAHGAAIGGALTALAAEVMGAAQGDAARSAGTAYALAGMLRAIPYQSPGRAYQGRLCLPADVLSSQGLKTEEVWSPGKSDAVAACVRQVADAAWSELAALDAASVPRGAISPLLQGSLARAYLRRLEAAAYNPFSPDLVLQPLARPLLLCWRALRRRP